jgi:hypothetical protein
MKAVRILDDNSADTTGLVPGTFIEVTAEMDNGRKEHFRIGKRDDVGGKTGNLVSRYCHTEACTW